MHVVDGVEMVDVREAARLASRSPETIRRWVWSGKVHAVKYGTKLLIPRREVEPAETGEMSERSAGMTLSEWADMVQARAVRRGGVPGPSAADLVLEDRERRSNGADS